MSTVLPVQPTATLDDFLTDPVIRDELAVVIKRSGLSIKSRKSSYEKRDKLDDLDAADAILDAWRRYRP